MKSVCAFLLAVSGASAFAPQQSARTTTSLNVAPELQGLRGVGIESGGKVVSLRYDMKGGRRKEEMGKA